MKIVFKYPLLVAPSQVVALPVGAEKLHVAIQNNAPTLWALVDPEQPDRKMLVECYGTGQHLCEPSQLLEHLGTVQTSEGLVWHYFQRIAI